jgi:hypothetical protein
MVKISRACCEPVFKGNATAGCQQHRVRSNNRALIAKGKHGL